MNAYEKIRAVLLQSQLPLSTGIGSEALAALAELEKSAAPAPPVVGVDDAMCERVSAYMNRGKFTCRGGNVAACYLESWRAELGPHLGLVTREELARQVGAAYRECGNELCHYDSALVDQWWADSNARKRLEGGE